MNNEWIRRETSVTFETTEETKKTLRETAKGMGMTVSALLRIMVDKCLEEIGGGTFTISAKKEGE